MNGHWYPWRSWKQSLYCLTNTKGPPFDFESENCFFFVLEKMWSEYNYLKSKLHLHVCVCVIVCVCISDKAALD